MMSIHRKKYISKAYEISEKNVTNAVLFVIILMLRWFFHITYVKFYQLEWYAHNLISGEISEAAIAVVG